MVFVIFFKSNQIISGINTFGNINLICQSIQVSVFQNQPALSAAFLS
jgi:hypothetical protein